MIEFIIPGNPVAKGRPRITTISGSVMAYTPAKTRSYEDSVRLHCLQAVAASGGAILGPVAVSITAFIPIPASWSKKRTSEANAGIVMPATRPDIDNYAKAILDGMNGAAFSDDAAVVDLMVRKRYSSAPRVHVVVQAAMHP